MAVSTLAVCAPAVFSKHEYYRHRGLTHVLLDGQHRMHAAADTGGRLRLLSLLSLDNSLGSPEEIDLVPELRRRPPEPRHQT